MALFKVTDSYKTIYTDPITLNAGDTVSLGKKEEKESWKGWIWAENSTHKGWIPLQILEVSGDNKTGKVTEFYTAKELDVEKGDTVIKQKSLNGWVWCMNTRTNEEGWIPGEIIEAGGI